MKFQSYNSLSTGLFSLALALSLALAWLANAELARAYDEVNSEANYELSRLSYSLYTDAQGRQVIDAIQGYDTDLDAYDAYDAYDASRSRGLSPISFSKARVPWCRFICQVVMSIPRQPMRLGCFPFLFVPVRKGWIV